MILPAINPTMILPIVIITLLTTLRESNVATVAGISPHERRL